MTSVPGRAPASIPTLLARGGGGWIRGQRKRYRPRGRPLTEEEKERLVPFFRESTLRSVRIARVPGADRAPFYRETVRVALRVAGMSAITFGDTIVLNRRCVDEPIPGALLFHELVHVVQFEALGTDEFARRYVLDWLRRGLSYSAIPLERAAYRLQAAFEDGTLAGRVTGEVATIPAPGDSVRPPRG